MPGAHSDVGGGYVDNVDEVDLQILDLDRAVGLNYADKAAVIREREWVVKAGWFDEEEVHDINFWNELKGTRFGISNSFSHIGLKIMAKLAGKKGVLFKGRMFDLYETPDALKGIENAIVTSPSSSPEYWHKLDTEAMRAIRHKYLHFSAFYGSIAGANQPNFTGDDPIYGRRKRIITNG